MSIRELEESVSKLCWAFAIRNVGIARDLIAYLCTKFTLDEVAAIALLTFERLVWLDAKACRWAMEHILPEEVKKQIDRLVGIHFYQQLLAVS
ncbi:hypothetical protein H6G20_16570 [Desertifilum sp. FACHB-1129]|uniref:Uncharacterized protein n=3 Tax=Cyanophyceae TaxID=3028117 RepID=A0A1E5QMN1_9CYAN|nr:MULTISPECIES: hypothetical protein [Cyanophyceae]MCD8485557.1 hypothetical protein [Desertifilum sp.]MDA0211992.1 hypothetical protein [Cyanobacteria bacterium FC1]MDI9638146.1 hypothetical protein [Geitlerinema splendidum]MDK3157261.1 hypothetical protein [Kamptonema cortianum]MDL5051256.1 hypothetical protein [Oscillatoria amoena NRMC-F 0135]NES95961.1 hypothetical protein [Desertifilum sp. SIO1I2]